MILRVLGSSSQGNSYVLESSQGEVLLLEAGVKFDRVKQVLGFDISRVAGCLITHEHGDHAAYVGEVLKATISVFASEGTFDKCLKEPSRHVHICRSEIEFKVGGFRVIPFLTAHDAEEPLGFFINHPESGNILFATDTAYLPCKFGGLNNVMLECNYHSDYLDESISRGRIPASVKSRIISSHMSYEKCLQTLRENDLSGVNNIVLLHLSEGNSNAELFKEGVKAATGKTVHIAQTGLEIEFNKTPF